ncbi:PTS transporter subunit EIIC [Tetragenococcus halophilus]|uniref:Uncharacterized protein n=1 Tax=Tetragenococcus halophilus subsp. halophilus TaxID=1513897 RepID=A0A2H6CWN6_TETHA|nr:PTS transporter subunit EIIC [Tetragenococcus halophilus]GBD69407.1 hypothetical protein TEHN7118_2213 [Tetragenococcus halophilus subsp. halophilus]
MRKQNGVYQQLATELIQSVGGQKNIEQIIHCVTRLRFYLKDETLADKQKIESLQGVLGIVKASGQFQVVVGPAVDNIYQEIIKQLAETKSTDNLIKPAARRNLSKFKYVKELINRFIGIITGSVMPIISILAASGIIKSLLAILTTTNIISATENIYMLIEAMSDAVFYFLPILIGFNAAKRLKGNPILTAVIGAVLIYPSLLEAAENQLNIVTVGTLQFPFVAYTYSIFPMVLAAWFVKVIENWLKQWVPIFIQAIFIPIVVIASVSTITFLLTGPIIIWISQALAVGLQNLLSLNAPIFGAIIDGFYQILVIFGLHWGIIPIYVNDFAHLGYSYLSAMVSVTIVAQGGAALAVAIKTKKVKIKELGYAGAISAFCGITEPAIYGINLRFRKPFICASIASAIGGLFTGIFQVNMWSIIGSIIGLPSFVDPVHGITSNFWYALLVTIITLVSSFILTYIWGYNDTMEMQKRREKPKNPAKAK